MQFPDEEPSNLETARLFRRESESQIISVLSKRQTELDQSASSSQDRNWRKILVIFCILATECCERVAFYGVTGQLVILLNKRHMENPSPSTVSLTFSGICCFSPLIGGIVADAKLGRFNTVFGGALVYVLGFAFLCASTHESKTEESLSSVATDVFFIFALFLIAIGAGGIKANIAPLGADQVKEDGALKVERFFLWYYWSIQIGAVFAFTVIAYVQQKYSFFFGYVISGCSMFIALVIFTLGRNSYITFPPVGSFLVGTCKVIWFALTNLLKCRRRVSKVPVESCFDRAKRTFGGPLPDMQVEDVKLLLKLLPIFLSIIVHWAVNAQTQTTFLLQGVHMDLSLTKHVKLSAASLSAFECITVAILIPLLGKVVFPVLLKIGIRLTPLKKMSAGMLFAAVSVGVAGWLEIERKKSILQHGTFKQKLFDSSSNASHMSIFYQTPQYVLLGVGEVLVAVTGLEFAYMESPRYIHGVIIGIYLATIGAGFFLASALVAVVSNLSNSDWYPEDINQGSMEYFFFLLSGLMVANFVVFLAVSMKYRYLSQPSPFDPEIRHFSFSRDRIR